MKLEVPAQDPSVETLAAAVAAGALVEVAKLVEVG